MNQTTYAFFGRKIILGVITALLPVILFGQNIRTLEPCPKSPNCVSTEEGRRWKSMEPISFDIHPDSAMQKLINLMGQYNNARLVERDGQYMHYEFKTAIGGFIDDVELVLDPSKKLIYFRSASRKGYGDFSKNKRRMKKIRKDWYAL